MFNVTINFWIRQKVHKMDCLSVYFLARTFLALCLMLSVGLTVNPDAHAQAVMVNEKGEELNIAQDGPQTVHTGDSLALVAFYHSMNGHTWGSNAGWLVDPVVTWDGIRQVSEINGEWRVTRLGTFSNRYNMRECGFLPPEIGDLEYLERYTMQYEFTCGDLPNEIFALEYLERIEIRGNFHTGEIRWDLLADMPSIERLSWQQNYFEGPVMTADVARFQRLHTLRLTENSRLTGQFPPEIGQIEGLQVLYIPNLPRVSGPFPDLSGLAPSLTDLEAEATPYDPGPFPEFFKDFENLVVLYIWETNIEGPVPDWIIELPSLRDLKIGGRLMGMDMADFPNLSLIPGLRDFRLRRGSFTGELPDWFQYATGMQRFWINDTDISGELPGQVLRELTNLELLWFSNNKFTGGLPAELAEMTTLAHLDLSNNNLTIGNIPEFIGNDMIGLERLKLANSGITGTLPANLENIVGLDRINFSNNPELTGDIPEWMKTKNWQQFDISHTGLNLGTSEFPDWVQNMHDVYKLGLAGFGMEGPIPDWFGNMRFLRTYGTRDIRPYIDLSNNNLSGPIPESMGNHTTLDSLNLANNQLTGNIDMLANVGRPFGNLSIITSLDVSGNPGLEGPIPMSFTDALDMRVFKFDGTALCEPDDQEFRNWLENIPTQGQMQWPYTEVSKSGLVCDPVSAFPPENVYTYRLSQNYPNPFNPSTTIQYEIPVDIHVTLNVYNVIGQRIATLVNESVSAGQHTVSFNGSGMASGTYIYRLEAGDRVLTQTMMLIK